MEFMNKVYLWKKDDRILMHTDLVEAKRLDGLENPDLEVNADAWNAAGATAYIHNGEIILGGDPLERAAKDLKDHQSRTDRQLDDLDRKKTRPVAAIAKALAAGNSPDAGDVARLNQLEAETDVLRAARNTLPV
jgi:hypothetical protein